MGPAPGSSSSICYMQRDAFLNAAILESLLQGGYTVVVGHTLWSIYGYRMTGWLLPILVISSIFILETVRFSTRWWALSYVFVEKGDSDTSICLNILSGEGSTYFVWIPIVYATCVGANICIGDAVLIWRCWTVWGRRRKMLLVLGAMVFCEVLCDVLFSIQDIKSFRYPSFSLIPSLDAARLGVIYLSLSLGTTVICTTLIVTRILRMSYMGPRLCQPLFSYAKVIEIVVESAALYSAALIVHIVIFYTNEFFAYYSYAFLYVLTGLAPTMLVSRVIARANTRNRSAEPTQSLAFGGQTDISHHQEYDYELDLRDHSDADGQGTK